MLVAEDSETGEIKRFIVVDASISLGEINIGGQTQSYGPEKLLSYIDRIQNRLFDYVNQYSAAFNFIPRRTYQYLKKPPILSEMYRTLSDASDSGWLIDYFLASPLMKVMTTVLPRSQRQNNAELAYKYSMRPPYSPRIYHIQDLRYDVDTDPGWACLCNADELEKLMRNDKRSYLINCIQTGYPIIVQLESPDELDALLSWLVSIKDAGLKPPNLFIIATDHRIWDDKITRLADIPNSRILTVGCTITSLSDIINYLKQQIGDDWSTRVVYASGYPNTSAGDSITEILSFLLSRRLKATHNDIQRVLGTNILQSLPIRPNSLQYIENESSVIAEGGLGKSALGDLQRIFQILASQNIKHVISCDHLISAEDGHVDMDSLVVTIQDEKTSSNITIALHVDHDQTLIVSGWRRTYSDSLISRTSEVMTTLIRATATSSGEVFDSPSHLTSYTKSLLRLLQVSEAEDIVSALHFNIVLSDIKRNTLQICPEDLRATGLEDDDLVLILDPETGQWYAGKVSTNTSCLKKGILVSRIDAATFGLIDRQVDLVKYESSIEELETAVFAIQQVPLRSGFELSSYIHLHREQLTEYLRDLYIGKHTRLSPIQENNELVCFLGTSIPELDSGMIGVAKNDILLRPSHSMRDLNVIICLSFGSQMGTEDISNEERFSISESLKGLQKHIPEIDPFLKRLQNKTSRSDAALLMTLNILNLFMMNRSGGKLALVLNGNQLSKFSIQKGNEIQNFVEFDSDLTSGEVITSLAYTLLDSTREDIESKNDADVYRAIAEYLEDMGAERPTLILLLTDKGIEQMEEAKQYLRTIRENERYSLDVFGLGEEFPEAQFEKLHEDIRSRIYPVKSVYYLQFIGYLVSAIETLIPTRSESMDIDSM